MRDFGIFGNIDKNQGSARCLNKDAGKGRIDTACIEPKSGSYPVVGKPDVGFGGPMMGAMRSLM
jgi:hypothetical protein